MDLGGFNLSFQLEKNKRGREMDQDHLCFIPATELLELYRKKEVSPVEVVVSFLERIERVNPVVNAYCTLTQEMALEQANLAEEKFMRGEDSDPLLGVPVSIKDLIITKGVRTTRGSLLYADYVPDEDAPLVERLKGVGAVILGKTNTPEFGWRGSTDNQVFGASRNPWNLNKTPGGSSGGASAQVAARLGPLAIGTDGGGSIRIPASYCGIFGLKPTFGLIPVYPPSATGDLSHPGPMTVTVADAALLLQVVAGPDSRDRLCLPAIPSNYPAMVQEGAKNGLSGLRIAFSPDLGYAFVEPEVAALVEKAAMRFKELGAEVEVAHPGFTSPYEYFVVYFYGGLYAALSPYLPDKANLLDPGLLKHVSKGNYLTGLDCGNAAISRANLYETVRRFFNKYDLLLTPTMPQTAFPAGIDAPDELGGQKVEGLDWTPFTYPFNLTGQPAASVPCGFTSEGMPVGLQIVGRRFEDALVLKAAAAYETIQPWADKRPEL
jgi:aspartyl-tRNA(Asn)/glutamyl-tRNA(Gln) amidotransferase subunit A